MDKEKKEALEKALKSLQKTYGEGSVMRMGDKPLSNIPFTETGSLFLDKALGIGGLPKGRIIEIFGTESSGKTTIALQVIAEAQKNNEVAAFIDAEHALDINYAKKLGVNVDDLIMSQPDNGEQALEIVDALVKTNAVGIIVVDSVAALVPQAEIEGDMGDSHMGLHARLMSQAMRKLSGAINKANVTVIFINQVREKLNTGYSPAGHVAETTTGGRALKFYSSVRIEVRRGEQIKENEVVIGNKVYVKIVKNKVAPPFRTAVLEMIYGQGISHEGELIDIAIEENIIERKGSWFAYKGENLCQGREKLRTLLKENIELHDEILQKVKETFQNQ